MDRAITPFRGLLERWERMHRSANKTDADRQLDDCAEELRDAIAQYERSNPMTIG